MMYDCLGQIVNIGDKVLYSKKSTLIPCEYVKDTTRYFVLQSYNKKFRISKLSIVKAPIQASNYKHPMKIVSEVDTEWQSRIVKADQALIVI